MLALMAGCCGDCCEEFAYLLNHVVAHSTVACSLLFDYGKEKRHEYSSEVIFGDVVYWSYYEISYGGEPAYKDGVKYCVHYWLETRPNGYISLQEAYKPGVATTTPDIAKNEYPANQKYPAEPVTDVASFFNSIAVDHTLKNDPSQRLYYVGVFKGTSYRDVVAEYFGAGGKILSKANSQSAIYEKHSFYEFMSFEAARDLFIQKYVEFYQNYIKGVSGQYIYYVRLFYTTPQ